MNRLHSVLHLVLIAACVLGCSGVSPAPIRTTDETGHFIDVEDRLPFDYMWRGGEEDKLMAELEGTLEILERCVYVHVSDMDFEEKVLVSLPWLDTRYDPNVPAIATHFYELSITGDPVFGIGGYSYPDMTTTVCHGDVLFEANTFGPSFRWGGTTVPELYEQYQRRWNPTDRRLFPTPR